MKTYNYNLKDKTLEKSINLNQFKNSKNILIQIFCGEGEGKLKEITNALLINLPQSIIIGTTTDGEIKDKKISILNTVLSISIFDKTEILASYEDGKNSFDNGYNLAKKIVTKDTKLLILFADGTSTNGENFLKGIEAFDNSVPICGGMAGDNGKFIQTFVSYQNILIKNGAVGVSLNSDYLKVHNDYRFNWSPIGIEHTIDKVEDNRVYSINGMLPIDFYAKYLGEDVASTLPTTGIEFPLISEKDGFQIARAIIAKHKDGSISFAGNLQKGDKVKLGFGNAELIMQNPIESFDKNSSIKPETFFLYSCMARRRYMPNFIQVEVEPFAKIAPTSGFFTYAEFFHYNNKNLLLNQTLTIIALTEEPTKISKMCFLPESLQKNEHSRVIRALTHLIQQSTKDYDEQTKKLNQEKQYSHDLLSAQRQFLRHTVHETNTPLSSIMWNIELHEMEFGKNRYLTNIEVAMKNLFSIYDDLSYLIKKDQIIYTKQQIDLVDYTRTRIDFFSQVAIKAHSRLIFQTSQNQKIINFNETKLQRIIDNNLTNAIKYSFENEDIYIIILETKNHYKLQFTSHSTLIQDPKKVFEEYYREEKIKEGFGLGLNLVKRICDEEEVEIDLESNKNFTTFTYHFKKD
ncbi:FIST N-terminal domain-containing protein [Halarcobacter ebronensis]|uniref:histidine kinase n=1 Tax=Halarcobacter ebronensis TaxID=1462615 RepID=A0A4Q1AWX5_9BACT|nr:FIST N-terminal domain-containing protein [Halarcobacter ebronensis]QKF83127.1 FIST sensor-containing two-component system histidine kinase [Halarcobacter ebronensis]RXK05235.1 diguanylate cyclase [Halarcobacter ebronensis]